MFEIFTPKFAKKYANLNKLLAETFTEYRDEVRAGKFPGEEHVYGVSDEVMEEMIKEFGKVE
jgi:3-methyl-2-oxobutanoate hydroxymethyltransferase